MSRRPFNQTQRQPSQFETKYAPSLISEFIDYLWFLKKYFRLRLAHLFFNFERQKDKVVDMLYRRRGKYARPFVHSGLMSMLIAMGSLGPFVLTSTSAFSSDLDKGTLPSSVVLGAMTMDSTYSVGTLQAEKVAQYRGGEVIDYEVVEGDTISVIAQKFDISPETVLWANNLGERDTIKPGQKLKILPVTGVIHTVKKGETIYTIAKKYGLDGDSGAQAIVDYPFNEFVNDEKFTIAVGQSIIIPGGEVPRIQATPRPALASRTTPDRGTVSAAGSFVWPASGRITQGYSFYHKAIDIANRSGGAILAADAGTISVAGWPDNYGYGNRVVIDHDNGFVTLYAHLSVINVQQGQTVNRGDVIGQMGSTGRSTGTHLHFEIRRKGGGLENPLNYLR